MNRLLLVVILCGLTGCAKTPAPPPPPTPEVGIVTVRCERAVLTTELPGRTSPYLIAEVRPQVNGILLRREFVEGAEVKAGSMLYLIDPARYLAAYEEAKTAVAVAEANVPALRARVERMKGLVAIHAVGEQDYDDAVSSLARAEASVAAGKATAESARINVEYTPVRAPISGRIGRSNVTVGALVTAYQPAPLAVVQQLDPIYVDVTQASADILRLAQRVENGLLKPGRRQATTVKLLMEDGRPYAHEGTLQFRDVSVEHATGSVVLRLVFPNPERTLLPGMFVRAIVEEGENDAAILVPQQGITRDVRGEPTALVVNAEGKVEQRELKVDRAIGTKWLVTKGLAPGDQVVVEGMDKVRPGTPVRAVQATLASNALTPQPQTDRK
jgi:membrane fusion protein (multidrug efflux system)